MICKFARLPLLALAFVAGCDAAISAAPKPATDAIAASATSGPSPVSGSTPTAGSAEPGPGSNVTNTSPSPTPLALPATQARPVSSVAQERQPVVSSTAPNAAARPGVYINGDLVAGRCSRARCVPLCQDPATQPNPEHPDWGWEASESCVMPHSDTALVAGGDRQLAIQNHGYPAKARRCLVEPRRVVDFYKPPALDPKRKRQRSFTTHGSQLIDAYGEEFVPRAVNNANGWYDICGQYSALEALDDIAATGANAVRIGWAFDSIDPGGPGEGPTEQRVVGTNPDLLAEVLHRSVELGLIPIVAFNDSTGQTDASWAETMASKITAPKYLRLFKAYEAYLLLGIANELNLPYERFATAYTSAIRKIRAKGYQGTLVVTANEWGQGCDTLLAYAPLIIMRDPLRDVVFDLHVYTYVHYHHASAPNRFAGGDPERIAGCLDELAALEVPLLVGEFGQNHSSGPVAWQTIIERTNHNRQGYAPWLWYGDTEYPQLNMNVTWEGPLTEWGKAATADFATSSKKASLFR